MIGMQNFKIKQKQVITCMLCGEKNSMKNDECSECKVNLTEQKNIYFSKNKCIHDTVNFIKKRDFIEAYASNSIFLDSFPGNQDSLKLEVYILFKLKNNKYKENLTIFEKMFPRDRWILSNTNKKISKPIIKLEEYQIGSENVTYSTLITKIIEQNRGFNSLLFQLINDTYQLYAASINSNSKQAKNVENYYNLVFLKNMSKKDITITDNNKRIFNTVEDGEKGFIHVMGVKKIKRYDRRYKDNEILTSLPQIKYKSKIIQNEKILLINKSLKNKQEVKNEEN